MRASFLLVLALALFVGLGVAVAVKTTGLLTPPPVVQVAPPPPVVVPPTPPPPPNVLVSARNLYEGETVRPGDVRLRPARPDEAKALESSKSEFPAANAESAYFRFLAKNVEADTPIRRSDLTEMKRPDPLNTRLAPGFRAVNVSLPKSQAAGGLVGVGDWVDVYLTTEIGRTDEASRVMHTGLVARNVQVIAKRDSLFSGFAPLDPKADIPHTLAANPYRAALIEYARTVGTLTLVPLSDAEKKTFDDRKKAAVADPSKALYISVLNPDSAEYKDEEKRVEEYKTGTQSIGGEELARVFNLKPIVAPPPPPAPKPAPKPVSVETFSGLTKTTTAVFQPTEQPEPPPAPPAPKPGQYLFYHPAAAKPVAAAKGPTSPTITPVAPR